MAPLPWAWSPKKSALRRSIGALRTDAWEAISRVRLASARLDKVESGKGGRVDSTVTESALHGVDPPIS